MNRVIGIDGRLPWDLPNDMRHFRRTTNNGVVIMGRLTHESIGRCLPNRTNIVLTRDTCYRPAEGTHVAHSIDGAVRLAERRAMVDHRSEIFFIGGGEVYASAMSFVDRMYVTHVRRWFVGDKYFPVISKLRWRRISKESHGEDDRHAHAFDICVYERLSMGILSIPAPAIFPLKVASRYGGAAA